MDSSSENHPLNLNSPNFDSEAYVNNLIQKKGLDELVAVEEDMVQNVRRLDSEMQQLVYENYNKFLTATTTVRNMQTAFADMDNEVEGLSDRMKSISALSDSLSQMFNKNRANVKKLTENSKTIQRLQYFVQLPKILQELIEQKNYKKAVEIYVNVRPKLEKYKETKSMFGIYSDCKVLMEALEEKFRDTLVADNFSAEDVFQAALLLRSFGASDVEIRAKLLAHWREQLTTDLHALDAQIPADASVSLLQSAEKPAEADVLDFVDGGCCTFLTNLSLYISIFVRLFTKPEDKADLMELVESLMRDLEALLKRRFLAERNSRDCALFVKALDRISRKISVLSRVLLGVDFSRMKMAIVVAAAEHQIKICRENIKANAQENLAEAFESLGRTSNSLPDGLEDSAKFSADSTFDSTEQASAKYLDAAAKLEQLFLVSVKTGLANLLLFTANDMNFNNIDSMYFCAAGTFSVNVFENVVAGSLSDLSDLAQNSRRIFARFLTDSTANTADYFLVFCAFLHGLKTKHIAYLVDLSQEQFKLIELKGVKKKLILTTLDDLTKQLKSCITDLLRNYVETECTSLNNVVVKSFENFDWPQVSEAPRSVRALAKHFLHCLENINAKVSYLTGEKIDAKKEQPSEFYGKTSSDLSSSSIGHERSATSSSLTNTYETTSLGGSSLGGGGAMGIMEKLWSDEPDEQPIHLSLDGFGGGEAEGDVTPSLDRFVAFVASSLDFRRKSIVGAVVRVCLWRMAECLARCSFSAFGLQQLQLDCAYLKHHLFDIVGDEHALNALIEECVTAAVSQCAEPRLLEPTLVRAICERR